MSSTTRELRTRRSVDIEAKTNHRYPNHNCSVVDLGSGRWLRRTNPLCLRVLPGRGQIPCTQQMCIPADYFDFLSKMQTLGTWPVMRTCTLHLYACILHLSNLHDTWRFKSFAKIWAVTFIAGNPTPGAQLMRRLLQTLGTFI